MSSTKDCGCLRDADGKIDMTRCPIHPTPSTKDPKKCPTCGYQKGDIDVCSDSFHLDTPQATKPVDELTMTVYFTERQLSELKAGEKLELPLTDDLRQAISNQVASAVKEAQALIAQEVQKARGCVDCGELRCENCKRLWQT